MWSPGKYHKWRELHRASVRVVGARKIETENRKENSIGRKRFVPYRASPRSKILIVSSGFPISRLPLVLLPDISPVLSLSFALHSQQPSSISFATYLQ